MGIGEIIDGQLAGSGVSKERIALMVHERDSEEVYEAGFVKELIDSAWDVDKMDYLLRDSLYCGVRYGNFDLERLLDTFTLRLDEGSDNLQLGVDQGGIHAVEGLILARYFMFTQVYFHPVRRAFDHIMTEFIKELLQEKAGGPHYPETLDEYLEWNDSVVLAEAFRRASEPNKNMAYRIISRQHLKAVYETVDHPDQIRASIAFNRLPQEIRQTHRDLLVWADQASDHPEKFKTEMLPVSHEGSWYDIKTVSKALQGLEEISLVRIYADVRGDEGLEQGIKELCSIFMSKI